MMIYFASDHAGATLRSALLAHVQAAGHAVCDLGPYDGASVDYPDFAVKLAEAMQQHDNAYGIAVCGSGIGISIALNRFSWVRAALVSQPEAAALARQHNNANVIALPARFLSLEEGWNITRAYMDATYEGGRHQRRVDKIAC